MVLVRVEQGKDGYLRLKLIDPSILMRTGQDVVLDLALDGKVEQVLTDLGALGHYDHSRWRVYPQDITLAPTIAAGVPANTFGGWVEVIPLNTIPFPFHVVGVCICVVSAATSYHIQLGYNTINADPGANMEMGERRIRIAGLPIARETELLVIKSQGVPANSRVMARLKSASGVADTAVINVVLSRHVEVSREVPLWPAFPW